MGIEDDEELPFLDLKISEGEMGPLLIFIESLQTHIEPFRNHSYSHKNCSFPCNDPQIFLRVPQRSSTPE